VEEDRRGEAAYAIALADQGLMALAGLWETWRSPAGERIRSFAIITTTPNELCAELHDRMPVVLQPETWPQWLGEEPADAPQLKALLAPYPSEGMVAWPVSPRVGNVKNNDPSLIEPIAGAGWARWRHRESDELAQTARYPVRYAGTDCVRPRGSDPLCALLAA
jgi:putative SOS response-associated peptidase YedK